MRLLELLALLEAHLEAPDDAEVIAALLEMATSDAFDLPLSAEAAALWRARADAEEGFVGAGEGLATPLPEVSAAKVQFDVAPGLRAGGARGGRRHERRRPGCR